MIIVARPPNFDAILAAFPGAASPDVIFAYGPHIYVPSGKWVVAPLLAHENVHCDRQAADAGPVRWWEQYLSDPDFRYREETLAHAAEYRVQASSVRDRNRRAQLLQSTARRLIAPLYNYQPARSLQRAVNDLAQEIST